MANIVFSPFFEKVFLFLKFTGTAVQTVQPLLSKGCSCTTSVPLSQFYSYKVCPLLIFDFLKTEKWCENYYGQLAVAVPSHPPQKKAPIVSKGEIDRGIKSTEY
ncbi:MAG: hypothetical protein L7U52_08185 [Alphaproteobacteria bacterium]|nr:hypothetical protein [Alphaproteobacteria bacterium]